MKCVESTVRKKKRIKKKERKDKYEISKELEQMRKIQRWAESVCVQEEKGNKIKRWRRVNELLREANTKQLIRQNIADPKDL